MKQRQDQRPPAIQKIKLRWWAVAFVPIALIMYAGVSGWLPTPLVALAIFSFVFWAISGLVAMFFVLTNRQPREPRQ